MPATSIEHVRALALIGCWAPPPRKPGEDDRERLKTLDAFVARCRTLMRAAPDRVVRANLYRYIREQAQLRAKMPPRFF